MRERLGGSAYALVMRRGLAPGVEQSDPFRLNVRVGLGHDPSTVLGPVFDTYLKDRQLLSLGTAKQGLAIELSYRSTLKSDDAAGDLVKALNRLDGVQGVSLERMDSRVEL